MLGEVGLDRVCRIPYAAPSPTPYVLHDNRRDLSPFTIPIQHQLAVLEAQLDLAVELKRNVSFHSVKSQQQTTELLDRMKAKHGKKWATISVDMHSCGLSVGTWKDLERKHSNVFLSLSTVINSRTPMHKSLIATCPDNKILAESDYNNIRSLPFQTWSMLRTIAEVKGWTLEEDWLYGENDTDGEKWGTVRRLEENWKAFQRGGHKLLRRRDRKKLELDSDESDHAKVAVR